MHLQDLLDLIDEGIPFPAWLRGVPTLVSTDDGSLYQGSSALKKLVRIIPDRGAKAPPAVAPIPTPSPVDEFGEHAVHEQYNAEGEPPIADMADAAFEPLVDGDVEEDDGGTAKIEMSDINAELSRRGLGTGADSS